MKERRTCERFQLSLPARLELNSSERTEVVELHTRDISAAGALLLGTAERYPVGTRCHLEVIVANEKIKELTGLQGLIKIEGLVVRSIPDGVAICFDGDCQILGFKGS